jgi:hypothetical protein
LERCECITNKMTENLKELLTVEGMVEAEIIKSKLVSYNIPCILQFESAGRLYGITMNGLGKVKVMVAPEDLQEALEVMHPEVDAPE